jgi:ATP-dependent protease ClpP protease subunit
MTETEATHATPLESGKSVKKPDWRRPNPSRAIEVFGEFTDELGQKLLSQIHVLREQNNDSITVYINSVGGSILVLKYINGLLDSRDLNNEFCRTVSVASGTAASAGAILLAFGDYAYAYEHSLIHFHAVRTQDLPETFQDATQVLGSLERSQREISRSVAQAVIRRVIFRYQTLKEKFDCKRTDVPDKELIELTCFLDAIRHEISGKARSLVEKTYRNVVSARSLTQKVLEKSKAFHSRSPVRSDAKVLIGVIKHEISEYEKKKKHWRIDERGAIQIVSDYLAIRDYNLGEHREIMGGLLKNFGIDFLPDSDKPEYKKLQQSDPKKSITFLWERAMPTLEPLWYYTISLCRILLEDENRLTPADAYWMGIIDEVIGTDLTGFRAVAEANQYKPKPSQPHPASSATVPLPPSSLSPPAHAPAA